MGFDIEAGVFLVYAAMIFVLYFFGRVLVVPLKIMGKIFASSILGGIILVLINIAGKSFGIFLPVNIITAAVTGLLGLPGIVAMITFFAFF